MPDAEVTHLYGGSCTCGHVLWSHVPTDEGTTQPCSECDCTDFQEQK